MRLFYDNTIDTSATEHILSEEESKHIVKVLRLKKGDKIGILNGFGSVFTTEISDPHPKRCALSIVDIKTEERPNYDIHIAVGPTKQMERLEWFIEKATEIGITEITLLTSKNSERVRLKLDRLERKAISAMKQSLRSFLPVINELTTIEDFVQKHPNGLIAHCLNDDKAAISEVYKSSNCPILIGPEGDFTNDEIENAIANGYKSITLGENRLRTETAALYACMQAKLATE
jgi:16S rRNA (uracil1498-N3)-methyltransferase